LEENGFDKIVTMDAKEIKRLRRLVKDLKAENEYLKSPLYLFEMTEAIQGTYSVLLNPPPLEFSATKNQKACTFQIDINDIICVKSDGKIKWIYFVKKQTSIFGERSESDRLSFTGTIDDFCKKYDAPGIHLCIVSRSVAVNPHYYFINSKKLRLLGETNPHNKCNDIPISPKFINDFIERKSTLEKIISFQKIPFRSK
jgi:hypothetical protein